ncbi:hypothetical protein DYI95_003575 [Thermaerobacter sp. PB12/4term]|uniref:hypothetical protein n=1 Tax=Thermaerobacter sp. PB12/4term TaxID=2293838 RepID=UPI000E328255|nr:hypothetical protein [Thermaerobacter sp. PB12/4term]QIA26720.1 hypothetical protein DYI95_003575 [Thermaerobacter sp. PB12/4term]
MKKVWRVIVESLKKVFLVGEPPDSPGEAAINPENWQLMRETLILFLGLALAVIGFVVAWYTGRI